MKRTLVATICMSFCLTAVGLADHGPTDKRPMTPSEKAFVAGLQADLSQRFATVSQAQSAGYVRYTGVDPTGAVSYANKVWQSADAAHPSQLWYDRRGTLLGADFSRLKTGEVPPQLWGVRPGRWSEFDDHIHFVIRHPKPGSGMYDNYVYPAPFAKAGGDPKHPDAATLVKMGKAKSVGDVVTVFDFPTIWDLIVWVKPNPAGAFADGNPLMGSGKFWGNGGT